MSIWGHEFVHVEKDVVKKCWVVSTANIPHQHLVTIPWEDAFRHFKHAPDYTEAIATCLSHDATALTRAEEREVRRGLEARDENTPKNGMLKPDASKLVKKDPGMAEPISLDAYRKKKRT